MATTTQKPEEWKLIVTILCLFFATPLGIIFMWMWMKNWPKWLKILITVVPIVLFLLWIAFIVFIIILASKAPHTSNYRQNNYTISSPAPLDNIQDSNSNSSY
jgi:glucan phosphoethanolaminetransferase (alkaline phosphatase superfamily)